MLTHLFIFPSGVEVIIDVEANDGYLPVFDGALTYSGEGTCTFDSAKQQIKVNVPTDETITIKAVSLPAKESLDAYTWSEISTISGLGLADKFFKVYDPNNHPELSTKKVQLKHQDSKGDGADVISDGEIYQTVRIIGINQDCTDLDHPDETKIGITFEFADLISDNLGYSLATQWNDTAEEVYGDNYNYFDSSIRMALVNEKPVGGAGHILWAQKGNDHWSNESGGSYTNKSVLDMLPDELTKEGILKTPAKYINIWNDKKQPEAGWEEQTINDKLFLLSPAEMGRTGHEYEEPRTTAYSYYDGAVDEDRIKKQIKGNAEPCKEPREIPGDKGQTCQERVYNAAGFNWSADSSGGGFSWLRSPVTDSTGAAWGISYDGSFYHWHLVYNIASAVAPAFCI